MSFENVAWRGAGPWAYATAPSATSSRPAFIPPPDPPIIGRFRPLSDRGAAPAVPQQRGHRLVRANGRSIARVVVEINDDADLIDLDDPAELPARDPWPSGVATSRRTATQDIAASIFREGAVGLSWWSTLDADWTNVTLFWERALPMVRVAEPPRALTTRDPDVRDAALRLGIALGRHERRS
jgi:hypothetical protein